MKNLFFGLLAAFLLVIGIVVVVLKTDTPAAGGGGNVAVENGTQIVTILAKGGYLPRATVAAANLPTILRVKTNGTFDCSAALVIPSVGYRGFLPATGQTDIPVAAQAPGAVLRGVCGMGMYNFSVSFE